MASKSVALTLGTYTQLDTGADTAIDAQNTSSVHSVKVIFAATIPAVGAAGAFVLRPGQAIPRLTKTDLMWALPLGPDVSMVVGE